MNYWIRFFNDMNFCLNLCEILNTKLLQHHTLDELFELALENYQNPDETVDRLYLGSSFCSQYFLNSKKAIEEVLDRADKEQIPVTLVLPIFSQKDLKTAKVQVEELLKMYPVIDEVTVNDLGMLYFMQNKKFEKINLGRLFFKDPRDIRVTDHYENWESRPGTISLLENYGDFIGIELDQISEHLDYSDFPETLETVALHTPYTYMTTGNICKFASINKKDEEKFRPNARCGLECQSIHEFFTERFRGSEEERELFRLGRTVYFLNDDIEITGRQPDRLIYFPLKELALLGQE